MSIIDESAEIAPGIALGYAGQACGKPLSEDFFDCACPDPAEVRTAGLVFALADGMSGGAGRRAAEMCVRTVLSDFYGAPATWEVGRKLEKVIASINAWLLSHNMRAAEAQCMLSTLSVLVLHEASFHVAHVGDCRIYRLRGGHCECMTTDHVWPRRDMRHVLRRAVGLDHHLVVDCFSGDLMAGDRFVLMSDGVWEVLGDAALVKSLQAGDAAAALAQRLVQSSIDKQRSYFGRNDATAAVVDVDALSFPA
jgi:protein phosphatase